MVSQAVDKAMEKMKTSNVKYSTPKTLYEFLWQAAQTFGIPVAAFCVILLIGYKTVPNWVNANIETQRSLTRNLDNQTDTLGVVGEQLKSVSDELSKVAKLSQETELFREVVTREHKEMEKDIKDIKVCAIKMDEDRIQQREEHKAMIKTLEVICEKLDTK